MYRHIYSMISYSSLWKIICSNSFRSINRQIKLISKIDSALKRIKDGTYGFCDETGDPIGLKRLMARPVATLSIAAQEKHEKEEKVFADD